MTASPALKIIHSQPLTAPAITLKLQHFHVWIKGAHILNDISVPFQKNAINTLIGPSGSGKSTLIRSINRINDDVEGLVTQGNIQFNGQDIYAKRINVTDLRAQIGMVFQKPSVFPQSIRKNVLFGIQQQKKLSTHECLEIVEANLKAASLWKEVSHRLNAPAHALSIGQQQRLCIARTLAMNPKVILLDEPTASLDPVSTHAIENLMQRLKQHYTLILVTHNITQARRIADRLIFMCNGKIIEQGDKTALFEQPQSTQTRQYLNDEFCEC